VRAYPTLLSGFSSSRYGFEPARGDNIAVAIDLDPQKTDYSDATRPRRTVCDSARNYTRRPADFSRWQDECERIYLLRATQALSHLPDFRPWAAGGGLNTLAQFRKVADPELILFAEDRRPHRRPGFPAAKPTMKCLSM